MDTRRVHDEFKEFLRLQISNSVEYPIAGGYAINCYGFPRATGDLDIWIGRNAGNAEQIATVLKST